MKKFNKFISLLLAVIMMIGSLSTVMTISAFAEETGDGSVEEDYSEYIKKNPEDYTEKVYLNADEKIASMGGGKPKYSGNGYDIYVDDYSGEVAIVNTATGEKLFTNPWNVATDKSSNTTTDDSTTGSIKEQLLSQIELSFSDITGQNYTYTSFRMASMRDQIKVKNIKSGVRVEYTIGREQTTLLVPRYIEESRFHELLEEKIIEGMQNAGKTDREIEKFLVYYQPVSRYEFTIKYEGVKTVVEFVTDENGNKIEKSETEQAKLFRDFPALKEIDVMYTISEDDATPSTLARIEEAIKNYTDYSFEDMEYDHEMTQYVSEDENPPVFKMALEYTIDENGLSVRLPANGIRFNESLYTLTSLTVLPYMGAGSNWTQGYNFMPDGSGAKYEFDDPSVKAAPMSVYNQVYGSDYAYHELTGTYEKTIRYPVFGTVSTSVENEYIIQNGGSSKIIDSTLVEKIMAEMEVRGNDPEDWADSVYKDCFTEIYSLVSNDKNTVVEHKVQSGFLAIIEEGDALTKIASYHGGNQTDYNSVKMQFTPRPSDSYSLESSISVTGLGEWTVVSERKYLGNYKMRYIMLSGSDDAQNDATVYDASWFGMAVAYRDYLTRNSILTPIDSSELTDDIPLYIESFGALETVERILSIPVDRMTALTTFENVRTMYEELSAEGINNINFKLTGFTNGGMYYTVPKKIKFESVVGGKKGFKELLAYAAEVSSKENANLGIFPDFDFAYIISEGSFDGMSLRKHAAKTIDGRYASKRVYSATQQRYINYYDLVISPAYFSEFYEKFTKNYLKYENINGISVGTLGNALNSDFDEDEPYNREDSKDFTVQAFEYLDKTLGVDIMTSGGNAYTWKYVDHILDVALDSSRQSRSSNAVPFIGVVLHGSIQFAGDPLNMEGDIQQAMLKAIENGASPYFVLSYQNTEKLKEDTLLSRYYSIRYDIWKDDLVSVYETLNNVLGDVQDKFIINHDFITGNRVPDVDEIKSDIIDSIGGYIEDEDTKLDKLAQEMALALANARAELNVAKAYVIENIIKVIESYNTVSRTCDSFFDSENATGLITKYKEALDSGVERDIRRAKENLENEFIRVSGSNYVSLIETVRTAQMYNELAGELCQTIADNTTDGNIIAQSNAAKELISKYYNDTLLIAKAPTVKGVSRSLVLLDVDAWINGIPTYAYGRVDNLDSYFYLVGGEYYGYDFYTYDRETADYVRITSKDVLNKIMGEGTYDFDIGNDRAIEGTGNIIRGAETDREVYNNGKLMNVPVNLSNDGSVYYSVFTVGGNPLYLIYEEQPSYVSLEDSITSRIEEIISEMEAVDAEFAADLRDMYESASDVQIQLPGDEGDDEEDIIEEEEYNKYKVDNIVVVTYGDKEAYKYVILNYNEFTVKVEFNGIEYTIAGYDFVDIKA